MKIDLALNNPLGIVLSTNHMSIQIAPCGCPLSPMKLNIDVEPICGQLVVRELMEETDSEHEEVETDAKEGKAAPVAHVQPQSAQAQAKPAVPQPVQVQAKPVVPQPAQVQAQPVVPQPAQAQPARTAWSGPFQDVTDDEEEEILNLLRYGRV